MASLKTKSPKTTQNNLESRAKQFGDPFIVRQTPAVLCCTILHHYNTDWLLQLILPPHNLIILCNSFHEKHVYTVYIHMSSTDFKCTYCIEIHCKTSVYCWGYGHSFRNRKSFGCWTTSLIRFVVQMSYEQFHPRIGTLVQSYPTPTFISQVSWTVLQHLL